LPIFERILAVTLYGLKGEFMQLWANALKEHPSVKDGTVKITIFDGNYDALTQNTRVRQFAPKNMVF